MAGGWPVSFEIVVRRVVGELLSISSSRFGRLRFNLFVVVCRPVFILIFAGSLGAGGPPAGWSGGAGAPNAGGVPGGRQPPRGARNSVYVFSWPKVR